MDIEILKRQLEREKLARIEAENILEKKSFELYLKNRELNTYLDENRTLLRQYKEAVDENFIVSKTDIFGTIIYINENFLKISGYSRDEVLGENHEIFKHEETSSELYQQMQKAIKSGENWSGILKYKKKNGYKITVSVSIKPIKNNNGKVQEIIQIYKDITDIVTLQDEIINTQAELIERIGEVGESRSKETGNHVKIVAEYSKLLALKCGLSEEEANLIKMASPMHDIGKVGIPDSILLKPAKLTEDEFELMKKHTLIGYEIFKYSSRELLQTSAIIAHQHHEKWNGKGYPQGLKGEEIHIYGRITAIADVFDALGSERVYKKAWSLENILDLFQKEKGEHFDPNLVDIFFKNLEEFLKIKAKFNIFKQ